MDYTITPEQQAAADRFSKLFTERFASHAQRADQTGVLSPELWTDLAASGFLRLQVPTESGGDDKDFLVRSMAEEALAKACPASFRAGWTSALAAGLLGRFGTSIAKERWLPGLMQGTAVGTVALSEPSGAPDRAAITCRATRDSGGWRIDGEKSLVVNALEGHVAVAVAVTGDGGALTAFVVDLDSPGVERKAGPNPTSLRACPVGTLSFDGVRVDEKAVLGAAGEGGAILRELNERTSLGTSHLAIGIGEAAMEEAMRYAREHEVFGKPLARQQAIHFRIADMKVEVDAARLMARRVAWLRSTGGQARSLAAVSKLFATEMAVRVTDWAVQIQGAEAYAEGSLIERLYRDARIGPLVDGASETQRDAIAAELLDD